MKYIVLSFDDGTINFYTCALEILKKYNLSSVLNVISNYANENNPGYLSWDNINDCKKYNVEIANHSASHCNNVEDIIKCSQDIQRNIVSSEIIGFASPHSGVCKKNFKIYKRLLDENKVRYIRSGNCIKRDGLFHAFLYVAYKYTKSKLLFSWYNKRNIIKTNKKITTIYPSITCNNDNTIEQIIYAIEKMPKNSACIIMLHNILKKGDTGYKNSKWSNTEEEFERLCEYLFKNDSISVITHKELCEILEK